MEPAGRDHGGRRGVDLRAPFGAEVVRYLAEDYRRPQRPLAGVVGVWHIAARDEAE